MPLSEPQRLPPTRFPVADAAPIAARIIEAALQPLMPRCEPSQTARISIIAMDLARLDGFAVIANLDSPSRNQHRFDFSIVPALLAAALGAEALRTAGLRLAGRDALLGAVRHRANAARPFHALRSSARWLVPASHEDRTLLHLAALALTSNGVPHKPWPWDGLPDHGEFSLFTQGAAKPFARHARCRRLVSTDDLLPCAPRLGSGSAA